jgi:hypothetical protein
MLVWDRHGFNKICDGTRYAELVILHPLVSLGHIVVSGSSGHKTATHYFSSSGGTGKDSIKSMTGQVTPNMCFYFLCDLWVT